MNILYLSHRIPFPPNKGEKIRTFHQIKYLFENNFDLGVLSPIDTEDDEKNLLALKEKYLSLPSGLAATGRLKLLSGLLKNQPLSVANFYSTELQEVFDRQLSQGDVDVVICSSSSMAEYVFRSPSYNSGKHPRPKFIMDYMDLDSDKWRQYAKLKFFPLNLIYLREAYLLRRYEQKIYENFDASFFISSEEVDLFLDGKENNGKLHAIPNGIDMDFFKPSGNQKHQNEPKLLFTGVMDYLPNEDAVIWFVEEVWPHLISKWPEAKFYIAGMNPSRNVESLAQHSGVVVTGFVDDIRQYYSDCHVFVAPLRLARGVQNKVLQAFASGLPVVTTDIGNEGIGAKQGEQVMISNEPKEFAESIIRLMEDNELYESVKKGALELVKDAFSWEGKLRKLVELVRA